MVGKPGMKNKNPLGKEFTELTRKRIQTQKLIDRLQKFGLSSCTFETDDNGKIVDMYYVDEDGNDITLSKEQIRAIEILLNKSLPNLSQTKTELEGNLGVTYIPVTEREQDPDSNDIPRKT